MARATTTRRSIESVEELVLALGGIEVVRVMFDLTPQAIHNWIAQDAVPRRYHAELLQITERAGLFWRPPGWDPAVQLRYRPIATLEPAA